MTGDEYRAAIHAVGLPSQNAAGRFFGVTEVTGRRWARSGPPPAVAKFLRFLIALRLSTAYVEQMLGEDVPPASD